MAWVGQTARVHNKWYKHEVLVVEWNCYCFFCRDAMLQLYYAAFRGDGSFCDVWNWGLKMMFCRITDILKKHESSTKHNVSQHNLNTLISSAHHKFSSETEHRTPTRNHTARWNGPDGWLWLWFLLCQGRCCLVRICPLAGKGVKEANGFL